MSSVIGDSQISLAYRRLLIAAIQLAVDCSEPRSLHARCCAPKLTGQFASESKFTYVFILTDFKK